MSGSTCSPCCPLDNGMAPELLLSSFTLDVSLCCRFYFAETTTAGCIFFPAKAAPRFCAVSRNLRQIQLNWDQFYTVFSCPSLILFFHIPPVISSAKCGQRGHDVI